jgi:hypothetical protein
MPKVAEAMALLVRVRQENNLSPGNKYFFASNSTDGFLKQSKVLAKISSDADLRHPKLIRSTKLRKYLATVAQVKIMFCMRNWSCQRTVRQLLFAFHSYTVNILS